jgi:translation initiation factor 2B subunit (eIF-2B alpha/beta/delta family)
VTLSPSTAARIEQIAKDRVSGASELALRAAELLSWVRSDELEDAARAVILAQPAMASVYNAAQAALAGRLDEFARRLRGSAGVIAAHAAHLVRGKVVLTHSFSSVVLRTLQESAPSRVLCTESLPGAEGRWIAELLRAEVVPDAAVYTAMTGVDIAVVGADAVTPQLVVNKVGTALVSLAARELHKPVWVLGGADKFVGSEWKPLLGELFEATPRQWFTGVVDDL